MFDLGIQNKIILITGATGEIGKKLSINFAKLNCKIFLVARNKNNLVKLYNQIGGKSKGHHFLAIDLNKKNSVDILCKKIKKNFKEKAIDIIIHGLGGALGVRDPLAKINDWFSVWNFNIGIAIQINNNLIPLMINKKWGRIIHISSINSLSGGEINKKYGYSHAYNSAKSYLNTYVKSISREYVKNNIVLTSIMPGPFLSDGKYWENMKKNNKKLFKNYTDNFTTQGRLTLSDEIIPFILFAASKHSTLASGTFFKIDASRY